MFCNYLNRDCLVTPGIWKPIQPKLWNSVMNKIEELCAFDSKLCNMMKYFRQTQTPFIYMQLEELVI